MLRNALNTARYRNICRFLTFCPLLWLHNGKIHKVNMEIKNENQYRLDVFLPIVKIRSGSIFLRGGGNFAPGRGRTLTTPTPVKIKLSGITSQFGCICRRILICIQAWFHTKNIVLMNKIAVGDDFYLRFEGNGILLKMFWFFREKCKNSFSMNFWSHFIKGNIVHILPTFC